MTPRNTPPDKQLAIVIRAITREGCQTAREVSAFSGLPPGLCSAYLCKLAHAGVIRVIARGSVAFFGAGRKANVYGPPLAENYITARNNSSRF